MITPLQYQISVFADHYSSRLAYVLDTICNQYGWDWSKGNRSSGGTNLSLYYTSTILEHENNVHVVPCGLLSESVIDPNYKPTWTSIEGIPSPAGKDIISSIFYLLTAYEEQQGKPKDEHGRIDESSLSVVRRGHAEVPLADRLMQLLANRLCKNAGIEEPPVMINLRGVSSIDVDSPTALEGKAFYRKGWVLAKAILKKDVESVKAILAFFKTNVDPFDTRAYLKDIHDEFDIRPIFFMLLGYDTTLDPSWSKGDSRFESLVRSYNEIGEIGIHPSYHSPVKPELVVEELDRLRSFFSANVTSSRQHFLRLQWPSTLKNLLDIGIKEDHSLAWAKTLGFRLGTARCIYWFDLSRNVKTNLRLVPPFVMDVTLRYRLGLSPKQAMKRISKLNDQCLKSNAGMRIIWHNSNLGPMHFWKPWRPVFEHALTLIKGQ